MRKYIFCSALWTSALGHGWWTPRGGSIFFRGGGIVFFWPSDSQRLGGLGKSIGRTDSRGGCWCCCCCCQKPCKFASVYSTVETPRHTPYQWGRIIKICLLAWPRLGFCTTMVWRVFFAQHWPCPGCWYFLLASILFEWSWKWLDGFCDTIALTWACFVIEMHLICHWEIDLILERLQIWTRLFFSVWLE